MRRVSILRRLIVGGLALHGLAMLVIMYSPVADWVVRPLIVSAEPAPGDVIVVMAAWASPDGTLNESGVWRTLEAARLYRLGRAPSILLSGTSTKPGNGDPVAPMAAMLSDLGIPASVISFDRESTNTHESAVVVSRIARERGWSRLVLVTDAKHMWRARAAYRKQGAIVIPAPAMGWEMWWGQPYDRYRKFLGAVHEYSGLAYYRWMGWV